MRKEKQTFRTS